MSIETEAHWEFSGGQRRSYAVATITASTPAEAANAAAEVVRLANKNAPKRSGRLSKSYGAVGSGTRRTVRSSVPYSGHQEFGAPRAHVPAKPHLRPALAVVEAKYNRPTTPGKKKR